MPNQTYIRPSSVLIQLDLALLFKYCILFFRLFWLRGLDIWCFVNLSLVPIPKSSHGKFFSGNAYLILHVSNINHFTSPPNPHTHTLFLCLQIKDLITLLYNSYNLEQTNVLKTGVRQNFVHYWLGENANEVHLVVFLLIFRITLML